MIYKHGLAVAGVFALLAPPGMAQPTGPQADDSMVACRQIDDDDKRLECFDAAMDARYGVNEELRERREKRRNAAFGLPSDQFGDPLPELRAIVSLVDEDMRSGAVTLQLDNGQVWRTTAVGGLRRFRQGAQAIITEGSMGGYRLRVEGSNGFRGVVRVR